MFLRQNSNNVVMFCMDIDVLLYRSVSSYNFFVMTQMAGYTGTVVKGLLHHKR